MHGHRQSSPDSDQLIGDFIHRSQANHVWFQQELRRVANEAVNEPVNAQLKPASSPRKLALIFLLGTKVGATWLLDKAIKAVEGAPSCEGVMDNPAVVEIAAEGYSVDKQKRRLSRHR